MRCALKVLWTLLRERPTIVVSTGAAPGYLAIRGGRLLGARTIWIDSVANVEELSMSGRMASATADLCLTQWPHLAGGQRPLHGSSTVIFVSVGTQLAFDRLIIAVDAWAARRLDREVFAQIGPSRLRPRHIQHAEFVSPKECSERMTARGRCRRARRHRNHPDRTRAGQAAAGDATSRGVRRASQRPPARDCPPFRRARKRVGCFRRDRARQSARRARSGHGETHRSAPALLKVSSLPYVPSSSANRPSRPICGTESRRPSHAHRPPCGPVEPCEPRGCRVHRHRLMASLVRRRAALERPASRAENCSSRPGAHAARR